MSDASQPSLEPTAAARRELLEQNLALQAAVRARLAVVVRELEAVESLRLAVLPTDAETERTLVHALPSRYWRPCGNGVRVARANPFRAAGVVTSADVSIRWFIVPMPPTGEQQQAEALAQLFPPIQKVAYSSYYPPPLNPCYPPLREVYRTTGKRGRQSRTHAEGTADGAAPLSDVASWVAQMYAATPQLQGINPAARRFRAVEVSDCIRIDGAELCSLLEAVRLRRPQGSFTGYWACPMYLYNRALVQLTETVSAQYTGAARTAALRRLLTLPSHKELPPQVEKVYVLRGAAEEPHDGDIATNTLVQSIRRVQKLRLAPGADGNDDDDALLDRITAQLAVEAGLGRHFPSLGTEAQAISMVFLGDP